MKMKILFVLIVASMFLVSCATSDTGEKTTALDTSNKEEEENNILSAPSINSEQERYLEVSTSLACLQLGEGTTYSGEESTDKIAREFGFSNMEEVEAVGNRIGDSIDPEEFTLKMASKCPEVMGMIKDLSEAITNQ